MKIDLDTNWLYSHENVFENIDYKMFTTFFRAIDQI